MIEGILLIYISEVEYTEQQIPKICIKLDREKVLEKKKKENEDD